MSELPLLIQVIEFSKNTLELPGRRMVTLIGEGYHGLWWEGEDGDWKRGPAVSLLGLIGPIVEQKEF